LNREDIKNAMTLAKELGLRVTEVVAMSRAQVEKALRTHIHTVKGEAKNGKHRDVPLTHTAERIMRKLMQITPRGRALQNTRFFGSDNGKCADSALERD